MREVIVIVALATFAACYDPSVRDCLRSCSVAADCLGGQECAAGFCVAPGGSCAAVADAHPVADAQIGADDDVADARTIDARPIDAHPIDAPSIDAPSATAELRIEVRGRGSVDTNVAGVWCSGPDGDCRYDLAAGTIVQLMAIDGDDDFRRWRNDCEGQGQTCTLTVGPMSHAKAEFAN